MPANPEKKKGDPGGADEAAIVERLRAEFPTTQALYKKALTSGEVKRLAESTTNPDGGSPRFELESWSDLIAGIAASLPAPNADASASMLELLREGALSEDEILSDWYNNHSTDFPLLRSYVEKFEIVRLLCVQYLELQS